MRRSWLIGGGVALLLLTGAGALALQEDATDPGSEPIVAQQQAPKRVPQVKAATPMAERVATIGFLNKRNGLSRDFRLKPGQGVRVGDAIVKLRACDQTEPWEAEQLTGAFVQLIVQGTDQKWRRYFSGWVYKETPSLNVVEHPVYDVWVKACTMQHPDIGPDTVVMSGGDAGDAPKRSSARKSPEADAAPEPSDSASSSNSI
jgi:hypothetical protein